MQVISLCLWILVILYSLKKIEISLLKQFLEKSNQLRAILYKMTKVKIISFLST